MTHLLAIWRRVLVTFFCLVTISGAPLPEQLQSTDGKLPSVEEELRQHHIELDAASLMRALVDENSDVRWLAATKLANDRVRMAIPAIGRALSQESEPSAKVNTAFASAQLGDPIGIATLKQTSNLGEIDPNLRVRAIGYLLYLDHFAGQETALNGLLKSSDDDAKMGALALVVRIRTLIDNKELLVIRDTVTAKLGDPTPAVRMAAAHTLNQLRDRTVIPNLELAISNEPDDLVRSQLTTDLNTLKATVEP